MLVEKTLAIVHQTPFAHDASATAYDTAKTFVGQMHIMATDTRMNGKIIHSLLTLLDQGIAVKFPSEVFYLTVHFLQCLIDGHGAYRYRAVTDNPFARFVNIFSGGKIHKCISTPFTTPYGFFYFLVDTGSSGRVTDVRINLHKEITADNHWFRFRMIDVGG